MQEQKQKQMQAQKQSPEPDAQTDAGEETKGAGDAIVTEPTELTYIFADGDEGAKASMNEIVEKFNETSPEITVTV